MKIKFLLLFIISSFFSCNCKKKCYDATNPECENFVDCSQFKKANAWFVMDQFIDSPEYIKNDVFDIDTLNEGVIELICQQDFDYYKWKIGNEADFRYGNNIQVSFISGGNFPVIYNVDITLVATRKPKLTECGYDDGVDTITRTLTIVPRESTKMFGIYRGVHTDAPNDTFEFHIFKSDSANQFLRIGDKRMYNFPNNYKYYYGVRVAASFNYVAIFGEGSFEKDCNCSILYGNGYLENNDIMTATFQSYRNPNAEDYEIIERKFIGRKIR